ncbi:MAG: HAD family phosphatase [Propioniciclava sp.]|uniref:HAD family hydrolase n=1 Tax=Propioniciclava sp. TaxID=2038686 RepID=UPI0039E5592A
MKAVIFDVAKVIVDWDAGRAVRGALPDEVVDAFLASQEYWAINAATDAGLPLVDAVARIEAELPEFAELARLYYGERFPLTVTGEIPGTTAVIDELLAAGVPSYGLSNWSAENFSVARAGAPVIDRLDGLIVSGEVGLAKPDEAIFRLALDRFGLEASETLMVDDTQHNLDAAARVGMPTHLFTSAGTLRDDLVRLGLLAG